MIWYKARHSIIYVSAIIAVSACGPENKPTSESETTTDRDSVVDSSAVKIEMGMVEEAEYPILGNHNAEEFLKQYIVANEERHIALTTRHGTIKIRLYDDTPLHTANFLMMVKREYFSGTEFTRIVKDFVVQGGNSERETDEIKRLLIGNYLISPEIHDKYLHKQGALAMARSYNDNPDKLSSAYDFYIVVGRTFNDPQLMALEREHDMNIPEWKRKIYRQTGGAPHLDGQHTVFGEVYEGMEVLHKMAQTPTDERNWPLESLIMQMEVIDDAH